MELTDSEVDDLLRAADPFPETAAQSLAVVSALDGLLGPLTAQHRVMHRRRGHRRFAVTATAIGLVAVGGAAAAASISFSPVSNKAPDFASSVRAATVGLPLPPGDSIDNYIRVWQQGETGVLDRGQLRWFFTYDAVCAWQGYWLQEQAAGNVTTAGSALKTLQEIPTWHPFDTETDTSTRDSLRADADAATAGNAAPVRQDWSVNCTSLPRAWASK